MNRVVLFVSFGFYLVVTMVVVTHGMGFAKEVTDRVISD